MTSLHGFRLAAALLLPLCSIVGRSSAQQSVTADSAFSVIAYVIGDMREVDKHHPEQLTHVNYCFLHLHDGELWAGREWDSASIAHLVSLKSTCPRLKVILSLGGWGGCAPCSDAFSSAEGIEKFTRSAVALLERHHADGLDLDWEFPAIAGYPGHRYADSDRRNFTLLIRSLRKAFGTKYELSFAAGGFSEFLEKSIDWRDVVPLVDKVNLMNYDLVNGFSTWTGHHTALYSTPGQVESTDHAVRFLDSLGIDPRKIVIGAAFYARTWAGVDSTNNGLFRPGKFQSYIGFAEFPKYLGEANGFVSHWDSVACAPYAYNPEKKVFATYDNRESIRMKTEYALKHGLGGIMFWQLMSDQREGGLLQTIQNTKESSRVTRPPSPDR
jgi:chitinase